jgi:hypothetical protein
VGWGDPGVFNDSFFSGLSGVTNALDNVDARTLPVCVGREIDARKVPVCIGRQIG